MEETSLEEDLTVEPALEEAEDIEPKAAEPEIFVPEAVDAEIISTTDSITENEEPKEVPKDNDNLLSEELKTDVKSVLSYMDHLLEALPDEKIEEFAKSEYFDTYKKLFDELGIETE